ncbi:MAG: PP2C family protein-serine/threonine phosphatase [Calditrichia bacterium]
MRDISLKLLYLLVPALAVLLLVADSLSFLIKFQISFVTLSLDNLHEIFVVALIIAWTVLIQRSFGTGALSVKERLWRLTIFLTANFILAFMLELFVSPQYLGFPQQFENFDAVISSNLIGIIAMFTLLPILQILRSLIFYRQKRTTHLYYNLFLSLLLISSGWAFISEQPLNFTFEDGGVFNHLLSSSLLITIVLLSLRNEWITYLPRKEKILYFILGIVIGIQVITLWEVVYTPHIYAFSLIAANIAYIIWLFLAVYCGIAMLTLLVYLPTSKAFDRKIREVNSLNDLSRRLNSELDPGRLNQLITQLTSQVLESQSTWLELYDEANHKLTLKSHINLTQDQIIRNPLEVIEGLNARVIREKMPVLLNDMAQQEDLQHISDWKQEARSLLAAPLLSNRGQLMGMIYASKPQAFGFDNQDLQLMGGFANQAAIALENAILWATSLEKERLEQELRVAREMQLKLVPHTMPEIPGYEVDSYFLTAYEVGGDYYDFVSFSDNADGFVIGDVSGKGTSAAFYMAEFKGVCETLAGNVVGPKEMASKVNRIIYNTIEKQSFITAIFGKLYAKKHRFDFVRAGHTPVMHLHAADGSVDCLEPPGMGIGLEKGPLFDKVMKLESIKLAPGDSLLLFTDGLVELRNAEGVEYDLEHLQPQLEKMTQLSAVELKEALLQEIIEFIGETALHDDLTMIVIKRKL